MRVGTFLANVSPAPSWPCSSGKRHDAKQHVIICVSEGVIARGHTPGRCSPTRTPGLRCSQRWCAYRTRRPRPPLCLQHIVPTKSHTYKQRRAVSGLWECERQVARCAYSIVNGKCSTHRPVLHPRESACPRSQCGRTPRTRSGCCPSCTGRHRSR
jgi:hypothetical protein